MPNENSICVHLLGYKHVTVLFSKYGKWFIILIPLHFCIYLNMFFSRFSYAQCKDIYEDTFNRTTINSNVEDTNRYYGGRNISVTKVVFPNGSIDPWHAMGVTKDISEDATAIFINGM